MKEFRRSFRVAVLAAALFLPVAARAQIAGAPPAAPARPGEPPRAPHAPPPMDPLAERLFPPELIMSHQSELGLSDKQRETIMKDIESTQSEILHVQWDLADASNELASLLGESKVNERKALAQADRVMELERKIKKAHLGLLIRIKNSLTAEQQDKLNEMRNGGKR